MKSIDQSEAGVVPDPRDGVVRLVDHPVELVSADQAVAEQLRGRELLVRGGGLQWTNQKPVLTNERKVLTNQLTCRIQPALCSVTPSTVLSEWLMENTWDHHRHHHQDHHHPYLAAGQGVDGGEDSGEHGAVLGHLHAVRVAGRRQSPHLQIR